MCGKYENVWPVVQEFVNRVYMLSVDNTRDTVKLDWLPLSTRESTDAQVIKYIYV